MNRAAFHITIRACDIGRLRGFMLKWNQSFNSRKKEAISNAIKIYLSKRTNWQ